MHNDVEKILFTEEQIAARVRALGAELSRDYAGKNPLMLCILKGAFVFFADLTRAMDMPVAMDFMQVSSYGAGAVSSGNIRILKDTAVPVAGRDVIIVEDIIDSGNSLYRLKGLLKERGASSVKICAFLDKASRRTAPVAADYVGYVIEDAFVVGYGLDYAEKYRNFPYLGILKREIYEK